MRDRTLQLLVGGTLLLVVVSGVVVATRRQPVDLDPGSPEGTVQEFVEAVLEGDVDRAEELATQPLCDFGFDPFVREDFQISLIDSEIRGDRAEVRVLITTFGGESPFERYESSYEDRFLLVRVDGDWKVDSSPWPFGLCPEENTP
jgi:hypothetical protein